MKQLLLICIVVVFIGCMNKQPIKLGYIGILTGKYSDLGISGRNGATIAIVHVNQSGGINGRKIELLINDNKFDPNECNAAAEEMLEQGVSAFIGPMTSDMSIALLDLLNEKKVPMISPSASTPQLSGLDDYFIRVNPPDVSEALAAAEFLYAKKKITRVAVVYDVVNKSFTEGLYRAFKEAFEKFGKVTVVPITFSALENTDFTSMCDKICDSNMDAVYIIAGSMSSAQICQQMKKQNINIPRFLTAWAMTEEFIIQAGSASEGVIFNHYHDNSSTNPEYLNFLFDYENRYGKKPDFLAALGYNAAYVIIQTLVKNPNPKDMKEAILEIGKFKGLQGEIQLDKYGDCFLERFYFTIKDKKIIPYEYP